jgi:hypothetical protein
MTTIDRLVSEDVEQLRRRPVDGWTHHVVDLDRGSEPRSQRLERPVLMTERIAAVTEVVGDRGRLPVAAAVVAQRNLSPRRPHQAAPLSYLNSFGRSWSLLTEIDRLEWAEFGGELRPGVLNFWFRDVVPDSVAIVSLDVTVASAGPNVTGSYEVRSSAAPPRQILVNGFREETVDIVVRPDDPFAVLVTVETGPGLVYFGFRSACYFA